MLESLQQQISDSNKQIKIMASEKQSVGESNKHELLETKQEKGKGSTEKEKQGIRKEKEWDLLFSFDLSCVHVSLFFFALLNI